MCHAGGGRIGSEGGQGGRGGRRVRARVRVACVFVCGRLFSRALLAKGSVQRTTGMRSKGLRREGRLVRRVRARALRGACADFVRWCARAYKLAQKRWANA
eukprot:3454798-Pleurochrysis_carterae.AAC.3